MGKNKKHFVAKKQKWKKNMDSEGWMWKARKRNSHETIKKNKINLARLIIINQL